jgi:hypothetical protein
MGVRLKPAPTLAFKRGGRGIVPVLPPAPLVIPQPPDVGDYAKAVWHGFWQTDVAGTVNMKRDGERLRQWARCVDAREQLWEQWLAEPVVMGATGEQKANPLFSQIMRLSAEIERAEAKFGMNPLDKMRLTGALDQAEAAETSIKARREGRRPVSA